VRGVRVPRESIARHRRLMGLHALTFAFALALVLANIAGAGPSAAPPKSVTPPKVTGGAVEGQLLQATAGKWRHVNQSTYAFQWQRCAAASLSCTSIPSAVDSIYALRHDDVGFSVRVVVIATNPSGSASSLSRRTAVVVSAPPNAPVNTTRPSITGQLLKGNVLTAQEGTWTGLEAERTRFVWRRCNDVGGSCRVIDRQASTRYVVQQADVGHTLRVLVGKENSIGKSWSLSLPTTVVGPVANPSPKAPKNTLPPTISGTARVGQTLTAASGSWEGAQPITFAFQWQRCNGDGGACKGIRGASQVRYTLGTADVRHRLRVQVTATNAGGSSSARSRSSDVVTGAPTAQRPANKAEPAISGLPQVGQVLKASSGSWAGTEPIEYAYRWRRCNGAGRADASDCAAIANATGVTYVLQAADVGYRLRVQVTASNRAGSATVASNPTAVITQAKPRNTAPPTISGAARVGETLHANRGVWTGKQPIAYAYQWLRCEPNTGNNCSEIAGATGADYRITTSDAGRSIRLRVTARSDAGSQSAISNFTNVAPSQTPPPATPPSRSPIPVGDLQAAGDRLVVSRVVFSPNPVTSRTRPITVRVRVTARGGRPVSGASVFMRATPRVVRGQIARTGGDGWVTLKLVPNRYFPQPRTGFNVQFFVKAYRPGDPTLGGVAGYRLVQVRLAG
jgi:hypothetical protein